MTYCKEMVTLLQNLHLVKLLWLSWTAMFCLHQPLKGAELSSNKHRKNFIERNYPCVMPVEYQLEEPGHTSMYVPILSMIQELFKNRHS